MSVTIPFTFAIKVASGEVNLVKVEKLHGVSIVFMFAWLVCTSICQTSLASFEMIAVSKVNSRNAQYEDRMRKKKDMLCLFECVCVCKSNSKLSIYHYFHRRNSSKCFKSHAMPFDTFLYIAYHIYNQIINKMPLANVCTGWQKMRLPSFSIHIVRIY